ncbi:hypothetical protein Ahy_B07g088539 isoform D [Arachis hypogaea]|uniref:Uncharacterized protein n=1 Tax=Arachis hypogaea TaxID=3818 RepID=A0A444YES7_ARAHY|nr:hypothetical protein Ahy_B07g088539 isoform D [Arachis hypogaea]
MAKRSEEAHPYAFHDEKYKRTVIACFIQATYLLELDRQENRTNGNALAPNWWIPFKYKLTQTLIDERDGSIFGAIFEWDRSAARADLIVMRPSGAPRAVLALRGTLLKSPTMRRDIEDDLRFLAWENLKGSVRFKVALEVLKSVCDMHGRSNVCIAGHSLGAGFALQVGKMLAKEGIYVETHLFNPPSLSLAISLRNLGNKAEFVWNRLKSMLPLSGEAQASTEGDKTNTNTNTNTNTSSIASSKGWMPRLPSFGSKDSVAVGKWVPNLYINSNDYICCSYTDPDGTAVKISSKENLSKTNAQIAAKLFVVSKEKQKFLEAHGLEQWWSTDAELQQVIHNSKVISRQLRSLYHVTPSQVTLIKPVKDEYYKQAAISCFTRAAYALEVDRQDNRTQENALAPKWLIPFKYKLTKTLIDERDGSIFGAIFEWDQSAALEDSVLIRPLGNPKAVLALRGTLTKRHTIRRDLEDNLRFLFLESLKGSSRFRVAMDALRSLCDEYGSRNVIIAGHSLGAAFALQLRKELAQEGIYVEAYLFNPPSVSLALSLENTREYAEYVWNMLKSMLVSNSKVEISNDEEKSARLQLISRIPYLSGLMDSSFRVDKFVPHLYVNENDLICSFYVDPDGSIGVKNTEKDNTSSADGDIAAKLYVVSKENQKFLEAHGLDQWWSSDAHSTRLMRRQLRSLDAASFLKVTCLLYPKSISLLRNNLQYIVCLENWTPQLSCLKDSFFSVPTEFFVVYKEKLKFLVAHGLEQWWPSDAELQQAIHNGKLTSQQLRFLYAISPKEVYRLFDPSSVLLSMSLSGIAEKAEFLWYWNSIHHMFCSSGQIQVSQIWNRFKSLFPSNTKARIANNADKILLLSGLKDSVSGAAKWVHHLYGVGEKMIYKENIDVTNAQTPEDFFIVSKEKLKFLGVHGVEQWFSSDAEFQKAIHSSKFISQQLRYLYSSSCELAHLFNPRLQDSNNAEKTSSVSSRVAKSVPVIEENMVDRESIDAAKLFFAFKEKQKFHGLEQWRSKDAENGKLDVQVTNLFNPPSITLAKNLIKACGLEKCWSSDAVLRLAIHNSRFLSKFRSSQSTHGKPW